MSHKLVPEIRVRAYPQSVIAVQDRIGATVSDEFGVMQQRDRGDGAAVSQDQKLKPATWITKNGMTISENLRMMQFNAEKVEHGTTAAATALGKAMTGFCLQGHEYPYNCVMEKPSSNGRIPEGEDRFPKLVFQAVQGRKDAAKRSRWDTVLPDKAPGITHIFHSEQTPDELVIVRTKTKLEKDVSFRLDLVNLQVPKGETAARIRWVWGGGLYSLVFRANEFPTVERKARGGKQSPSGGKGWEVWRQLSEVEKTTFKNDILVRVEQIGGRLCLEVNGKPANLIESREAKVKVEEGKEPPIDPIPVTWPAGKCTLYLWGVSATMGLAEIRYHEPNAEDNVPGVIRRVKRAPGADLEYAQGTARLQGWRPPGTVSKAHLEVEGDALTYEIEISPDRKGRYTPFITGIVGYVPNVFEQESLDPLDITPAVLDWDLNLAEPGIATSADLSLNIQRDVLALLPLPSGAPDGATWRNYLDALQYNPIDLAVRWRNEDGTHTPWTGLFAGYAWEIQKNAPDIHEESMSVRCRDKSARFKEPAGILDESVPPLSYLVDGKHSLFAADLIKEIIRIVMGDVEMQRLNGNGNARRFLPPGHLPLISAENDVTGFYALAMKLPLTGGLLFKPPYLKDAASWIGDFAKQDAGGEDLACFFYGYADGSVPDGNGEFWPVPIYGHLSEVLASRYKWEIGDTIYGTILEDHVLSGAGAQSKPEKDYNTVLVVNSPSGFSKESWPGPGLQVGRARVAASDPQAPERTWVRMQVRDLSLPAGAHVQEMADVAISTAAGAKAIIANLELTKGAEEIQWGDLIKPHMAMVLGAPGNDDGSSSDQSIDLNGRWFRCTRVRHFGNCQDREFRTSLTGHTLSNKEVEIIIGDDE